MLSDIDPMALTLVVVALAVVGTVIGVARRGRRQPTPDRANLPAGADAALWSITEVLPDPRNHLAIKDPTSELRLTARERAAAANAAAATTVRPADAARSAQSLAARRAALAKRTAPADTTPAEAVPTEAGPTEAGPTEAGPTEAGPAGIGPTVIAAAPSPIELVQATAIDQPLTIFLDEPVDTRHLTLLPEDLPSTVPVAADGPAPDRWGASSARAS